MSTTRTRMSAGERREQLLDVTMDVVAEHGLHRVTIDGVARAAGVSRPIVYGHFGDLAGLLDALFEREFRRALTQLAAMLPRNLTEGDPGEVLKASLRGYLDAARSDPVTWRLALMPPEGAPKSLRGRVSEGREAVVAQLAQAIAPGFGPGREPPDPELLARTMSLFADEVVRLLFTDPERYPIERLLAFADWVVERLTG